MTHFSKDFAKIYDQYVDKIYRFIVLKVNSEEVAQDLTSDVFTRGWQSFSLQKCDIKNIQAFLYQIARNLIVDHYREKGQAQLVSVDYAPQIVDPSIDLEEKAMLTSDINRVKAALASLKEEYREIVVWYYLDELKVPEIAKMLNKSEEAVRVQIHRALLALREVCNKKAQISS